MSFLTSLDKTVLPKNFGLVHKKNKQEINLRSFYISKEYVDPFVKSLNLSSQLKKLDVRRTQLNEENAMKLFAHCPDSLEEINAGENPEIGPLPVEVLCKQVLSDGAFNLHTVLLEQCSISD